MGPLVEGGGVFVLFQSEQIKNELFSLPAPFWVFHLPVGAHWESPGDLFNNQCFSNIFDRKKG